MLLTLIYLCGTMRLTNPTTLTHIHSGTLKNTPWAKRTCTYIKKDYWSHASTLAHACAVIHNFIPMHPHNASELIQAYAMQVAMDMRTHIREM